MHPGPGQHVAQVHPCAPRRVSCVSAAACRDRAQAALPPTLLGRGGQTGLGRGMPVPGSHGLLLPHVVVILMLTELAEMRPDKVPYNIDSQLLRLPFHLPCSFLRVKRIAVVKQAKCL